MENFKYETHLHTCEGSACGVTAGADYILPFVEAGYAGIFVTDHFFGGNTAADRSLSWKERVEQYCRGYENALAQAEKINRERGTAGTEQEFKVFFGIEQTFNGDDYLIYGLDKEWLLNHPEIEAARHKEWFEAVNSVNGLMIQAHPFRLRGYMNAIHVHPREVHGVEIYNAGNKPDENELAALYAKQYDFPVTSGSDIHNVNKLTEGEGLPMGGMIFEQPVTSVYDYADFIKAKKGQFINK
ncbi:MAG: PHP domain-containing protein [Treponema sp.]|nr:PHP domain-containing protein [Treponema sp.]